jgi:[ribosomal protein S5]-alanine N-acetyltransferase
MVIIKTKRLILRPLQRSDALLLAKYANDRTIYRNTLRMPHPYTLKLANQWINKNLKNYKKRKTSFYSFAIEFEGKFSGVLGIDSIIHGHKAELGYWLGKPYWKKGIMTEAAKAASDWAFKKYKLKRVYAWTFPWNTASQNVLKKAGFKFEGIARKNVKKKGKYLDDHLFSKIK